MTYVPKPVSRIYLCKKCRRAYLEEDIKAEYLTPEKLFEIIMPECHHHKEDHTHKIDELVVNHYFAQ
jgi:hypothetical protein